MAKKSKKEANVPNLRFPGFHEGWKRKKLGSVLEIGSGKDYKHLDTGDVPVFGTGGYMASVNHYLYDGETVCIGRKGTINRPFYYEGKIWTVDTLFYTKTFQGIVPKFCYNLFEGINWLQFNEASGVPSLSKNTIENIEVYIPNESEQKKISEFLFKIDKRIQTQNKIIQRLESLIKVLIDSLIKKAVALDSSVVTLSEIGSSFSGLSGKTKEHFGSGKKYIQYKQVFDSSKININNFDLVQVEESENQCKAKFGDVFFTISSETPHEIGMSSVLLDEVDEVYLNSFCFGFRPNSFERTNPHFLRFYFRSAIFRNELQKLAQGSTRYNMSKTAFLKLRIALPGIKSQEVIAKALTAIDAKIEIEKSILQNLVEQKTYFLSKVFI